MEKSFLTFSFLLLACSINAQQAHTCSYSIALAEVGNAVSAKYATDPIRNIFNVFPAYNDSTNRFEFTAPVNIDSAFFSSALLTWNYHTVLFRKENGTGIKKE
jgi:hypothetical protein